MTTRTISDNNAAHDTWSSIALGAKPDLQKLDESNSNKKFPVRQFFWIKDRSWNVLTFCIFNRHTLEKVCYVACLFFYSYNCLIAFSLAIFPIGARLADEWALWNHPNSPYNTKKD